MRKKMVILLSSIFIFYFATGFTRCDLVETRSHLTQLVRVVNAATPIPQKAIFNKASANIFSQQTNKLLPEPQASLLNGILWGEQKLMPKDFYEALRRTGTLHVIALSGMNITILISLIAKITLWVGRRRSVFISLILIVVFIAFVGASASVVRAGIMGGLSLIAVYFGRKDWALLSLFLAGGIMLIINSSWLTTIGFQLSFLATFGIILLGGRGGLGEQRELREGDTLYSPLFNDLRTTLAAQVFTMPIILYNFKQLSIIAPVTNILVLWIVQPIMVLGFVLSLLAISYTPLAVPMSWIIWVPLTFFIEVVKITASFPLAAINF